MVAAGDSLTSQNGSRLSRLDREILRLALPAAGSHFIILLHHSIDTWWVGRLPEEDAALAALSIASFMVWIFGSITSLVGIGLTSLVARYVGQRHLAGARYIAHQGLLGALALGVLTAIIGWVAAPVVYALVTKDPEVAKQGISYVRIFWVGGFGILAQRGCEAIFRAHGNTHLPFLVGIGGLVLNACLDPLFMFGAFGLPGLGVAGVALATIITTGLMGLALLLLLKRARLVSPQYPGAEELRLHKDTRIGHPGLLGLDAVVLWRVARVGLPLMWAGVLFSLIYLVISRITAETGDTAAQAALGLGHRGEGVAFILSSGYAAAATSLVGRLLGQGKPSAAARAAWRCALQCSIACGMWGLILYTADDLIAGLFSDPGRTRDYAAAYYRIIAWSLIPQALEIVLEGGFGGAGMTIPPMIVSIVLSGLRIPLAYAAVFYWDLGVGGIWWVISITGIVRGIVMAYWFQRNAWKQHTV